MLISTITLLPKKVIFWGTGVNSIQSIPWDFLPPFSALSPHTLLLHFTPDALQTKALPFCESWQYSSVSVFFSSYSFVPSHQILDILQGQDKKMTFFYKHKPKFLTQNYLSSFCLPKYILFTSLMEFGM